METKKNSILDFLSERNLIEIPIWQREFVWNDNQAIQLYEDIESLINNPGIPAHFFGAIIHEPSPNIFSATKLIDGQQRLIAISLFLCALCNHFHAQNYKQSLLFAATRNEKTTKIYYQNLSNDEYSNILLNQDFAYMKNSTYSEVYRYFLDKIESNNYSLIEYFNALKKFEIADIKLWPKDNPKLIYDSINSTGKTLSLFEKIKNYIFMEISNEEQFNIWQKYWKPLEKLFQNEENDFSCFLISYISMQTEKNISKDNLNISFGKFYNYKCQYKKAEEIISEIFKFAQYYIRLKQADFTEEIAQGIKKVIDLYDKPEIYSFLFEITDDFQNGLIPKKIYIDILENTYNYLVMTKNKQDKIDFSGLSKTISKLLAQRYEQGQ